MRRIYVHELLPSCVPAKGETLRVYGPAWQSGRFLFKRSKNESPEAFIERVVTSHAEAEVCIAPVAPYPRPGMVPPVVPVGRLVSQQCP